jgi:hypothetical protein
MQKPMDERVAELLEQGHSLGSAAKMLSAEYLVQRKVAYALALKAQKSQRSAEDADEFPRPFS